MQQYFFVSCALQDMIRLHLQGATSMKGFEYRFVAQLNDTHPAIAIPELMRLYIDEHDFETKTRHARRFLGEGNKVKVTLMFRGRQITHPELGHQVVARVAETLADVAKIETSAKLEGKQLTMILTPK